MITSRPTRAEWLLGIADAVAVMADCTRRQVAALIVHPDGWRIIEVGYNGAPAGDPGCLTDGACPRGRLTSEELPSYADTPSTSYDIGPGACIAVHAEQNAISRASYADMKGAFIVVTAEPCGGCIRTIRSTPLTHYVYRSADGPKIGPRLREA